MKELMGSIIAYNLVVQFRRDAAQLAKVPPRRLSFSGVWLSFQDHLLRRSCETFEQWETAFNGALVSASKRKLPVRKQPRNSPRIAHTRRQKAPNFRRHFATKKQTPTRHRLKMTPDRTKVSGIGLSPIGSSNQQAPYGIYRQLFRASFEDRGWMVHSVRKAISRWRWPSSINRRVKSGRCVWHRKPTRATGAASARS